MMSSDPRGKTKYIEFCYHWPRIYCMVSESQQIYMHCNVRNQSEEMDSGMVVHSWLPTNMVYVT